MRDRPDGFSATFATGLPGTGGGRDRPREGPHTWPRPARPHGRPPGMNWPPGPRKNRDATRAACRRPV